ncbi:MAG: flagellar type III secretion system pore protein FliP [Phycisphaerae bacterium]|nr:flagellar type III secretion system pore protein FliP [Phycisphaerae bacterium]
MGPPAPGDAMSSASFADPGSNPLAMLESAASMLPGGASEGATGPKNLSATLNIVVLLTVLTLVPSIMVMCTCFVRFVIVFALLKQALGAQNIPPSQVITALALFMTFLVMSPTLDRINKEAIAPYQAGAISNQMEMWDRAKQPVREFMFAQIEASENWSSLYMVLNYRGVDTSEPERLKRSDVDMVSLIPAYMLSELKVSFLMGFRVYLPFLIIDMVISSLLISMSMMMLPPVLISLPFKLLLFVLVDGWQLVVGSLMQSVVQPGG